MEAPKADGTVEMIVSRPSEGLRNVLGEARFAPGEGLVGDDWLRRPSRSRTDGGPNPDTEVTLMNARVTEAVAGTRERWPLAGDQLYVDLDLSIENLPPGARLEVGEVLFEISELPHTGCKKFVERFGLDAMHFVNSERGKQLRLRGVNATVVRGGTVRVGDRAVRVDAR